MMPFLGAQLEEIMRRLMSMFFLKESLSEASTMQELSKLKFTDTTKHLPNDVIIKLPTASSSRLRQMNATDTQKYLFKKECKQVLIKLLAKLVERSPLNKKTVRLARGIIPNAISTVKFRSLVTRMYDIGLLTNLEADAANEELEKFRTKVVVRFQEEFNDFDFKTQRVDEFYGKHLHENSAYTNMWKVMQYVFTLPHGQSHVERGFNINDDIMVVNMKAESLVAQRLVYDYMSVNSIAPHNIKIDNKMQRSCLIASSRRIEELNKAKATKQLTAQQVRKNEIKEEINLLGRQILKLNTYIENLEKQSTECFRNAGAEKDLVAMRQLVEEGNDAREMYEMKKKTKLELENAIQKLQLELAA